MSAGEGDIGITRWDCVTRIGGQDWRMRLVHADGIAWCSFGVVDRSMQHFVLQAAEPTPDLRNHFRRAVMRAARQH